MYTSNEQKVHVEFLHFGPRLYPLGSLVIDLVRQLVRGRSVGPSLNISDCLLVFLKFCIKLGYN